MAQGLGLDWDSEGMGKKDIHTHTEPSSGRLCFLMEKLKRHEAQHVSYIQLSRERALLRTAKEEGGVLPDKQRGGLCGIQLDQGDRCG